MQVSFFVGSVISNFPRLDHDEACAESLFRLHADDAVDLLPVVKHEQRRDAAHAKARGGRGVSSISSFYAQSPVSSPARCSIVGAIIWQGPHHSATYRAKQESRMFHSAAKLASVMVKRVSGSR